MEDFRTTDEERKAEEGDHVLAWKRLWTLSPRESGHRRRRLMFPTYIGPWEYIALEYLLCHKESAVEGLEMSMSPTQPSPKLTKLLLASSSAEKSEATAPSPNDATEAGGQEEHTAESAESTAEESKADAEGGTVPTAAPIVAGAAPPPESNAEPTAPAEAAINSPASSPSISTVASEPLAATAQPPAPSDEGEEGAAHSPSSAPATTTTEPLETQETPRDAIAPSEYQTSTSVESKENEGSAVSKRQNSSHLERPKLPFLRQLSDTAAQEDWEVLESSSAAIQTGHDSGKQAPSHVFYATFCELVVPNGAMPGRFELLDGFIRFTPDDNAPSMLETVRSDVAKWR